MTVTSIPPAQAQRLIAEGATLVDIRNSDEHARLRIPGAVNVPLSEIDRLSARTGPILFHCRSGMRTEANAAQLAKASGNAPCYILAGGIDAWSKAGLPIAIDHTQPLEIMRQVQLAAGGLVLAGLLLGFLVAPSFFGVSAFVGAGLMLAGATGWCGMAKLLQIMPWNRPAQAR